MRFCKNVLPRGLLLLVIFLSFSLRAENLAILSAGAVEPGLVKVVEDFEKKTGHKVTIQFGTSPQLSQKLANQIFADVLVTPVSVMQDQINVGKIVQAVPKLIGKVGAGITVRNELMNPKVITVDEFKEALIQAESLVYNSASTGLYLDKLFEKMGIAEQLKSKTKKFANGDMVLTHIINGKGKEIGFGAIPEIKMYESKGLRLVGPLPAEIQNYTSYVAAVMKGSSNEKIANELLNFITQENNRHFFKDAGIE
jgi:molybdate transport system substrate-binding protein